MPTQNQEDYLRTIFNLYEINKQQITSTDVAGCLRISKAAVSKMLRTLSAKKLIKMNLYSTINFTSRGLREAKKLIYKHRIIEVFLVDILKMKKNKIHGEAHKLEHAFSDEPIKKLAVLLNNPKLCPDGRKIPNIK